MKINDIKDFGRRTAKQIHDGELRDALSAMRAFSESSMSWETTSRIDRLEQNYRYMLDYFARGVDDPGRRGVYDGIVTEARSISDELVRRALMVETPTLYYNMARTMSLRRDETIASLIEAYRAEERRLNEDYETVADRGRRAHAEQLMRDIFARVWVTYPLSSDDADALHGFITDESVREAAAGLAVSALTMGMMEYYDVRRIELLLGAYLGSSDVQVSLRALAGVLMVMFRYRNRPLPPRVAAALAAAKESPDWPDDFKTAAIEFLRARDTERINRKMQDEVYPTLMKLGPGLQNKIGTGDLDADEMDDGENPDWEEMLNRDGLGDKLREMSEIQAEGGDVFMATFSHLKQFPFFNEIANWFLPFDAEQSEVLEVDGLDGAVGLILGQLPFLCDNDKYSVVLSLGTIPEEQKELGLNSLRMQQAQSAGMMTELEKADRATERRNTLNKYLQDLYRFYNLFRRKGEFFNPFDHMVNLLEIDAIGSDFTDKDTLTVVAEFCFKHKFYAEAARLFARVDALDMPDARRSQKRGYCHERLGNNDEAISAYEEAELLDSGSRWTLRHLAAMMRRTGRADRAVDYYQRLSEIMPDDFDVTINLAYALTEAGRTVEAETQFHKAVYYRADSVNARRGLGWVQFLNGKIDNAAASFDAVLASEPRAEDYLNAGHVARARGDMREAINLYKLSMQSADKTADDLAKSLENDRRWLEHAGIDTSADRLIIETIKYQ
ncbi:MAG: hypothetical protein Q4C34_02880 [Bacteroidales bacterium]|nr:hypothetical protein [Bacteroidales bacterium]